MGNRASCLLVYSLYCYCNVSVLFFFYLDEKVVGMEKYGGQMI